MFVSTLLSYSSLISLLAAKCITDYVGHWNASVKCSFRISFKKYFYFTHIAAIFTLDSFLDSLSFAPQLPLSNPASEPFSCPPTSFSPAPLSAPSDLRTIYIVGWSTCNIIFITAYHGSGQVALFWERGGLSLKGCITMVCIAKNNNNTN